MHFTEFTRARFAQRIQENKARWPFNCNPAPRRNTVSLCKPSLRLTSAQKCSTLERSGAKRRIFSAWLRTAGVSTLSGVSGKFNPRKQFPLVVGKNRRQLSGPDGGLPSLSRVGGPHSPSPPLPPSSSSTDPLPSPCTPGHFNLHFVKDSRAPTKKRQPPRPPPASS